MRTDSLANDTVEDRHVGGAENRGMGEATRGTELEVPAALCFHLLTSPFCSTASDPIVGLLAGTFMACLPDDGDAVVQPTRRGGPPETATRRRDLLGHAQWPLLLRQCRGV